jgi:hypothetical protein
MRASARSWRRGSPTCAAGFVRAAPKLPQLRQLPLTEAAKLLKVGRPSVQRAAVVLRTASPELVAAVAHGQIPVSTASKLAVLSEAEQVKVAGDVNPSRGAADARSIGRESTR